MIPWSLYYADESVVTGVDRGQWDAAPAEGVQVLVVWSAPSEDFRPWRGVSDRHLWTGEEAYTVHSWPPKRGSLMDPAAYDRIFARAAYGPRLG